MNCSSRRSVPMDSWSRMCWTSITGVGLIAGGASFRRYRRRSRPLVFLHGVWARAVANRVSMGVERAPLAFRQTMQGGKVREIEWAPPKEAPAVFVAEEPPAEEYGPWQWAAAFGRATGRFGADAFILQEDGKLRCPAGASLWLSEVRA